MNSTDITFDRMAYMLLEDNQQSLYLRQTNEFCKNLQTASIYIRPRYKQFVFNYNKKRCINPNYVLVPYGF